MVHNSRDDNPYPVIGPRFMSSSGFGCEYDAVAT